jgi:hypothetical protein
MRTYIAISTSQSKSRQRRISSPGRRLYDFYLTKSKHRSKLVWILSFLKSHSGTK